MAPAGQLVAGALARRVTCDVGRPDGFAWLGRLAACGSAAGPARAHRGRRARHNGGRPANYQVASGRAPGALIWGARHGAKLISFRLVCLRASGAPAIQLLAAKAHQWPEAAARASWVGAAGETVAAR